MRDLRTGERITVTNTNGDEMIRPGTLLLGRPLPVDDTWRAYSGFIRIPDVLRDAMLGALDRGDPFEVAALIGRSFAPPELQNTDREPIVLHELRYTVADAAGCARLLAASDLCDDGEGRFSLRRDTADQPDTIIMTLSSIGHELQVSVNSERRAEEARALVAALLPDAILEDDDVRTLDELARDDEIGTSEPDDPRMAAALDEFIRERERQWVDEPVPALDGLTPREASVDAIGRGALERLLRDYEGHGRGAAPTTSRLRALLELDEG